MPIIRISLPVLIIFCLGASSAIFANILCFVMIGKINERVKENERISYIWWGTEVRRKFKQLYPESRLVLLLDSCAVIMVLSFLFLIKYWVFG